MPVGLSLLALSAALLCAAAQMTSGGFARRGEWTAMSKKGNIGSFSQVYAFDPTTNIQICRRRTIYVAPLKGFDFTDRFNAVLKRLGKPGPRGVIGGTLLLGPGVYMHRQQMVMPSYTCIRGAGMDRTVIKLADKAPRFRKAGSIRSMWTTRLTITDLTQDGNRAMQLPSKRHNYGRYGFFSELSNYVYLKNFRVQNNVFYGFDPHGDKKFWSYRLVMENCQALNNGLDGFTIDQSVFATIIDGFSRGNDRHGYNVVTGTQLALFRNCVAENNGAGSRVGFGFVMQNNLGYGTGRIAMEQCKTRNNHKGAVKLRDVYTVFVSDSTFVERPGSICYELSKTRGVYLRRNACNGMRRNRKFKLGLAAVYVEQGDRSKAPPKPAPRAGPPPARPRPWVAGAADPSCATGKRTANACCPARCAKCGGLGCGNKANLLGFTGAVAACCVTPIRRAGIRCAVRGPPCVLA